MDAGFKTNLIIAFPSAAMGDGGSTVFLGNGNELLNNQRSGKSRNQGIFLFVHGIALQSGQDKVFRKVFFGIDNDGCIGADLTSFGLDGFQVLAFTNVNTACNYVVAFVLKPGNSD